MLEIATATTTSANPLVPVQVKLVVQNNSQIIAQTSENPASTIDLNPNPNPLSIPTQPGEVKVTKIVPLTLEEAILLAQQNNRELKIAKLQLEASQQDLRQAEAGLFPTISLEGNITRDLSSSGEISNNASERSLRQQRASSNDSIEQLQTQLDTIDEQLAQIDPNDSSQIVEAVDLLIQRSEVESAITSSQSTVESASTQLDDLRNFASTSLDANVSLSYAIFSPQTQASIGVASEQLRISELEVERIKQQLSLDVSLAYYELQQLEQIVRINEADVTARSKRLEGIKLLLDAALATRSDLLNAQVELNNSLQSLKNSQANQITSARNLARLLSLPPDVTPTTADSVEIRGEWALSLEDSIILALQNRVELEQRLAQRNSAKAERALSLSNIQPQLFLFASYDILQFYTDDPSDLATEGFGDGYSFGLTLSWTFYDGGSAQAGARRAEIQMAIAEEQYANQANQIRFEVEEAYFQLPTQLDNIKTAKQAVEQAKEAVDAAQIRFQANVATQTEVLDAQSRLVQAENNLVDAILTYNRSLAQLQRAVGTFQ